uniref:Uncharacterized protein n=1 Tax=Timema bartmani TaxID=61472 RepID=A0A7R9ERG3_9NEOP|nr:unnamed protein product [Timema bartmani]
MQAFSIFCGLGIHNTLMYSEVEKAMARQKVALEVLSYHATASNKEVEALLFRPVPTPSRDKRRSFRNLNTATSQRSELGRRKTK